MSYWKAKWERGDLVNSLINILNYSVPMKLTLKVAHSGRKNTDLKTQYYLRVQTADKNLFSKARPIIVILSESKRFEMNLGKAYDNANFLTNPEINEWVKANKFDIFPKGHPTALKFSKFNDTLTFINRI